MAKRHGVGRSHAGAVQRVEEIVLASSGVDAFELVFSLAAAHLFARREGRGETSLAGRRAVVATLARASRVWPWLGAARDLEVPDPVLDEALALVGRALDRGLDALDAVFEQLVTRVGKGDKGQFFTPRHVVDLAVRALALRDGETVVDPACGSGAFLSLARAHADVPTWGCDVDARAVRVAKLLAIATGADPDGRVRADALGSGTPWPRTVDVIATNPPFAGDVKLPGFELARLVPRAERDAFFLERALAILRPGGRIAIVLPHGKVGAAAWAPLRAWLVARARVLAVVSLPRETFAPHTSQRTVLLFAKKRTPGEAPSGGEKVLLATSERAGKDVAGEPIVRTGAHPADGWRALDHDLDELAPRLGRFLAREGFA
jgi:type I restriction enzyme M protein